ncbi:nif-specific transcriptional activator NifA [Roseospira navarrensis]|uniref:Nif-specific regulatory protein n=1 Tax=Roseospira navarrensis TaxID=140058 RepID=A0A7X2D5Z1_9PROT|nr:nif-specific transcriptional activator NifA [Roseospira navarrensis]MQX38182.1 nif-specific transcriptional activator NifA [Roseospira navarrensis]
MEAQPVPPASPPSPDLDAPPGTARSMVTLYEISKILSGALHLDRTLHDVLNVLAAFHDMRRGAIALAHPESGALTVAACLGLSADAGRDAPGGYPIDVAVQVHRTGLRLAVARMAEDPRFAAYLDRAGVLESDRVSFLCVPIRAGDESIGTLSVERWWSGPSETSLDDDLRVLSMVANLIGQTVRLHRVIAADRKTLLADAARMEKKARAARAAGDGAADRGPRFSEIVGRGPAMSTVLDKVRQVARTRAPVMLRGESGTGKEMIARALHRVSPRADKPFVCVNCAALPDTLLEAELFGHDKGAFTGAGGERKGRFEIADGGTLFLDEIGEISPAFQAKLLRVLQEGQFERLGSSRTRKVDVRIIAATNRNLEEAVAAGTFRADLYYRINVVTLVLPPLRERPEDIEPLARHFLERFNEENGDSLGFSEDAVALLRACAFPGNVRELENCITRVATMVRGEVIQASDFSCREAGCLSAILGRELDAPTQAVGGPGGSTGLPSAHPPMDCGRCATAGGGGGAPAGWTPPPVPIDPTPPATPPRPEPPEDMDGPGAGADVEGDGGGSGRLPDRERLIAAMEKSGWVQAKAARLLGLTPRQVGYALRRHDIPIKRL